MKEGASERDERMRKDERVGLSLDECECHRVAIELLRRPVALSRHDTYTHLEMARYHIEEVNGWTQEDGKGLPWPPRRSISLSFLACSEYRGLYEATCFTWPWSGRGVWCVNSLATVILAKLRIMSKLSRPTFTLRAVYESERSFEKGRSFEFGV